MSRSFGERMSAMSPRDRRVAIGLAVFVVAALIAAGAMALGNSRSQSEQAGSVNGQLTGTSSQVSQPGQPNNPVDGSTSIPGALPGEPGASIPSIPGAPVPAGPTSPGELGGGEPNPGTAPPSATNPNTPQQTSRRLNVSASDSEVNPRQYVTFSATNLPGGTRNLIWFYGNGATNCLDIGERPTHAYRSPGTYTVRAVAHTGGCDSRPPEGATEGSATVVVLDAQTASNGPDSPSANAAPGPGGVLPEDPHVELQVTTADSDGYVSRVVVDWDDGSPPDVTEFPIGDCSDTATTWPASIRTRAYQHDYLNAGTYDVTVTVTSVGCDGLSQQEGLEVLRITPGGMASIETIPTADPNA